ncbi:MAG: hypothetical protein IPL78_29920 [Chloroflexi bacterium]|nr:hypothetical protein [Chloroflexota bacterium]
MSKPDFREYRLLKNSELIIGPLTAAIVLPALIEALQFIKAEYKDSDDNDLKWVTVLKRKIKFLNLQHEQDNLVLAQKLLELPIKRALASAHTLAEAEVP